MLSNVSLIGFASYTHNIVISKGYSTSSGGLLTSVAFGYGWISDNKFQKFSDKDWIWIFKKFIGYGSGVENSISAHIW